MGKLKISVYLPNGENFEELYREIKKDDKSFGKFDLGFIDWYSNEIRGSTTLRTGQFNRLLHNSKMRIAVPGDDFEMHILNLIKNKYSVNFNALVVHSKPPEYKFTHNLWKSLIELLEEKNGRAKFPSMIQGFYTFPDDNEPNYGVRIAPGSNFKVIADERLSNKYNGRRFKTVDELGLPPKYELEKNEGERLFYSGNEGIKRMTINSNSSLDFSFSEVADFPCENPDTFSRMVIVKD